VTCRHLDHSMEDVRPAFVLLDHYSPKTIGSSRALRLQWHLMTPFGGLTKSNHLPTPPQEMKSRWDVPDSRFWVDWNLFYRLTPPMTPYAHIRHPRWPTQHRDGRVAGAREESRCQTDTLWERLTSTSCDLPDDCQLGRTLLACMNAHTKEDSRCSGQPYLGKARAARMRSGRPLMNAGILGPHVGDCLGTDGRALIGVTGGLRLSRPLPQQWPGTE